MTSDAAETAPTLDYGRRPSRGRHLWRLTLTALAIVCGLVLFAFGAVWWLVAGPGHYRERNRLRADLQAIPGVTSVQVRGHEDVTYEVHGASLTFDNDPTRTADIGSSTKATGVSELGGFTFSIATWGAGHNIRISDGAKVPTWAYGGGLNLGPNGPFAANLPFAINDVADIHAHYDELIDFLASMAPYPAVHYRDLGNGRKSWLVVHPPGVQSGTGNTAYDVLPDSDDPPTRRPTDLLTLPAASSRPMGR